MRHRLRFVTACALAIVVVSASAGVARRPTPWQRAVAASRYIAAHQASDGSFEQSFSPVGTAADAVLSLVAVRRGVDEIDDALEYLAANIRETDDNVGLKAKVTMAVVAGGMDPRSFAGRDLVAEIKATLGPNGQYGEDTAQPGDPEVVNHALALLALAAAGEGILPDDAYDWLLAAQCGDGGWQYDDPADGSDDPHCVGGPNDFTQSDTNTTAYAVMALFAATDTRFPENSPFAYFESARDPIKSGWGFDASFPLTDANSTALVIQAHVAAERPPPAGSVKALEKLQFRLCGRRSGAFAFTWEPTEDGGYRRGKPNVPATIAAIPGLLKRPLPIPPAEVTKPTPGARRCD